MKTVYTYSEIFNNNDVLCYCEDVGIIEPHSLKGNVLTYYSLYPEGMYKVQHNMKTGHETRKLLRYKNFKHLPKMFYGENGGTKYNYCCG